MASLAIRWSQNTDIANHFLIRSFNTDAIDILSSNNATINDLNNLYVSLKPYWNDDVKDLIYSGTNRKVLSDFFDRNL